jgi:hypothetical protein
MINKKSEKGVSLIITFFILIIILAVVLSISIILYSEIKIIRNIGNSVIAFYAADGAVEKVLYYDRQIKPAGAKRGLCSMCLPYDPVDNPNPCPSDNGNPSINCVCSTPKPLSANGCDPITCSNCEVSFDTTLVSGEKSYHVVATVSPDGQLSKFILNTIGTYQNVKRAIRLLAGENEISSQEIRIENEWLSSRSIRELTQLNFGADVTGNVSVVLAHIQSPDGTDLDVITMTAVGSSYTGSWTGTTMGTYYVDIVACDGLNCITADNISNTP